MDARGGRRLGGEGCRDSASDWRLTIAGREGEEECEVSRVGRRCVWASSASTAHGAGYGRGRVTGSQAM